MRSTAAIRELAGLRLHFALKLEAIAAGRARWQTPEVPGNALLHSWCITALSPAGEALPTTEEKLHGGGKREWLQRANAANAAIATGQCMDHTPALREKAAELLLMWGAAWDIERLIWLAVKRPVQGLRGQGPVGHAFNRSRVRGGGDGGGGGGRGGEPEQVGEDGKTAAARVGAGSCSALGLLTPSMVRRVMKYVLMHPGACGSPAWEELALEETASAARLRGNEALRATFAQSSHQRPSDAAGAGDGGDEAGIQVVAT